MGRSYHAISHHDYCSDIACIQMILGSHGFNGHSQEDLSFCFGVVFPYSCFTGRFRKLRIGDEPAAGYGSKINSSGYTPDDIFADLGIQLRARFYPLRRIEPSEFIVVNREMDRDIMAVYDRPTLHGGGKKERHASIVLKATAEDTWLFSPTKIDCRKRKVKLRKLVQAMEAQGEESGGFWMFRRV